MQDRVLFEYAVIRVVPRVEREEFINVGVVLYCAKQRFLKAVYTLDEKRLCSFYGEIDIPGLDTYLQAFTRTCAGGRHNGKIAQLGIAERFRWLTATRSTVIQTSKVHPGLCIDAGEMLEKLFTELVL